MLAYPALASGGVLNHYPGKERPLEDRVQNSRMVLSYLWDCLRERGASHQMNETIISSRLCAWSTFVVLGYLRIGEKVTKHS